MENQSNKTGLIIEDKITLLNRLSSYYRMSEFFFSLTKDTVRTANDKDITRIDISDIQDRSAELCKINAEKIKNICEKLKMLDVLNTDNAAIARKKNILRRKLLKLTRDISETNKM